MIYKIKNYITSNYKGTDSLKSRVIQSSSYLGLGSAFERIIRFVRTMILARLLAPDDFGVVAIAIMVVGIIETVSETGIRLSVIQNRSGAKNSYLNVAWWIQAARGAVISLVAAGFAPIISQFYENPELTPILRVSFIAIFINGLISPKVHLLEREFRFGRWAFINQLSSVIGTVVTLALAFYIRNVWALVFGSVIERFVYCVISFIVCPFRPSFSIGKDDLTELFKFAKGMFGLSLMNLISQQADIFVLGKVIPAFMLGVYYLTISLTSQPLSFFTGIISPVLLPFFVSTKDNLVKLKTSLERINRGVAIFGIPLSTTITIHSTTLLTLVYGEKYGIGARVLSVFAFNIFFRMQSVVFSQVFFATGNPHLQRKASLIRTIFIVVLIYPAINYWGIMGAALTIAISNAVLILFQIKNCKHIVGITMAEYLKAWLPGVAISSVAGIPIFLYFIPTFNTLFFQAVFGALFFTMACILGILVIKKAAHF